MLLVVPLFGTGCLGLRPPSKLPIHRHPDGPGSSNGSPRHLVPATQVRYLGAAPHCYGPGLQGVNWQMEEYFLSICPTPFSSLF